jgi:PAS domain S-box-containing protein
MPNSKSSGASGAERIAHVPSHRVKLGILVALFALLAMVVPLAGWVGVKLYAPELERDTYANLEAIAKLKAGQIENWLKERQGGSAAIMADEMLAERIELLTQGKLNAQLQGRMQRYFDTLLNAFGYAGIVLVTPDGRLLMSAGNETDRSADTQRRVRDISLGQVQRSAIYRDKEGHPHMHWLVPIGSTRSPGAAPVAVIVFRINVNWFIYPVIQTWPTASPSGETLLVRKEGNTAVFMNELRHRKDSALNLTVSLDTPGLPAGVAIQANRPGTTAGIDHRNVAVFAAYRPVAGTDWHIVAKMDRDEVLAPLKILVFWVGLIAFAAALGLSVGLLLLLRQHSRAQALAALATQARTELEVNRLDASVKESQARAQMLIDASLDAVISVDQDGKVIGWNRRAEQMFYYPSSDAIGHELTELIVPPHQREFYRQAISQYVTTGVASVLGKRIEVQALRADGSEFPIEISSSTLLQNGKHYFSAYVRDITERKAFEAQIRQLSMAVEQSPVSVVITNLKGQLEYVNEAFVQSTGYSRREAIGQNPRILNSGLTPAQTYDELWEALTHGRSWRGVFYNQRKDGSRFTEYAQVVPMRQPDGTITHYMASKEDITEKVQLLQELEQHRDHLEELVASRTEELVEAGEAAQAANRAKSAFLANMSHEIRTPMNAIVGFTHLLRRANQNPEQAGWLSNIEEATGHLLALISDILDISKIEADRLKLEQTDFHLGRLLDNVYSLISVQAKARGLVVEVKHDGVPMWLRGDPTRLRQALLNYLGNAIKFTSSGVIALRVRLLHQSPDQIQLHFEVQDSGIGIPADDQGKLFQAFEQADVSTTRKFGGTGLGLAITRRLARLMGGEAGVQSVLGEGSTFWLTACFEPGSSDAQADEPHHAIADEVELRRHAGARILLVDDADINREIVEQLLDGSGLVIDGAENGKQAVDKAQATAYDLVLMDLQMPVMDGLEATRCIHALPGREGVPILAMTANAFDDHRQTCLEAGMVDFMPKPVDPALLFGKLLKWLPAVSRDAPGEVVIGDNTTTADALYFRVKNESNAMQNLPGLDIERGLRTWRQTEVYARFLRKFAVDYGDSARVMKQALTNHQKATAAALAHKLKGAAANLALVDVARLAGAVDQKFKADVPAARLLPYLQKAMDVALSSIALFAPEFENPESSHSLLSAEKAKPVAALLNALLRALDADNPDLAEPILHELANHLTKESLSLVQATVNDFDFRGAQAATRLLAGQLSISLDN